MNIKDKITNTLKLIIILKQCKYYVVIYILNCLQISIHKALLKDLIMFE